MKEVYLIHAQLHNITFIGDFQRSPREGMEVRS